MADPVAWLLIEPGWRVVDGNGDDVGVVDSVRGDEGADIFDGLMIRGSAFTEPTYVAADDIASIVEGRITLA
jgi:ethanolamine utilization protein EutQ (cupin superfamily)